jgi:4-carboxymuconolactone decarboxylase
MEPSADFGRYAMEFVWGSIWTRPLLNYRSKELITIAALTALGNQDRLREHVRDALRNGIKKEELLEVMIHLAVYAGFPAATNGIQAIASVVAEREAEGRETTPTRGRKTRL